MTIFDSVLQQLQETNIRLHRLESDIAELLKENEAAIQQVESFAKDVMNIEHKTSSSATAIERKQKGKTIRQLWDERDSSSPLVVVKENWTNDYCFVVHFIDDAKARAHGVTFGRNNSGDIEFKKKYSYPCDEDAYKILPPNKLDVLNAIMDYEAGNASKKTISATPITIIADNNGALPKVKIGSLIEFTDIDSKEKFQRKIVSSYDDVRYKTMGYKTKNYVEITRISDADGVNTISEFSPIGKALMDKQVGESVVVSANGKKKEYEIISIE